MNMIEKVAKALYEGHFISAPRHPWDSLHDNHKREYLKNARIAIKAMREPTDEMRDACYKLESNYSYGDNIYGSAYWGAMINAALGEQDEQILPTQ